MQFPRFPLPFVAFLAFLLPAAAGAHPLDISSTTLTRHAASFDAVTYLHPAEVETILGRAGLNMRSLTYADYYGHSDLIYAYLSQHIGLSDASGACSVSGFATQADLGVDDIFTKGFPVRYAAQCPGSADAFQLRIDIFSDLPLQTNRVLLYDGATGRPLFYRVLTAKETTYSYAPGLSQSAVDSDGDGLSDEEEKLYRTDPHKADTDGDGYSDYEEVENGWDPLNPAPSPGQTPRPPGYVVRTGAVSLPTDIRQSGGDGMAPGSFDGPSVPGGAIDLTSGNDWLSRIFARALKYFDALRTAPSLASVVPVLLLLGLLGFLHALGPGHSKGFLVAYVLRERASVLGTLAYALLFTVVHLADIVTVTLLAKFALAHIDTATAMESLQRYGSYALVAVAAILVVSAVRGIRRGLQEAPAKPSGKGLWVAFLSGLAPCTFAWSIVLVLFAIGRLEFALPFLAAFGCGVFACLAGIGIVARLLRERVLVANPKLVLYAPLLSSGVIFILAGALALRFW